MGWGVRGEISASWKAMLMPKLLDPAQLERQNAWLMQSEINEGRKIKKAKA